MHEPAQYIYIQYQAYQSGLRHTCGRVFVLQILRLYTWMVTYMNGHLNEWSLKWMVTYCIMTWYCALQDKWNNAPTGFSCKIVPKAVESRWNVSIILQVAVAWTCVHTCAIRDYCVCMYECMNYTRAFRQDNLFWVCVCVCVCICICIYIGNTGTHMYVDSWMHKHLHAHIKLCVHIFIYALVYTYFSIYTYMWLEKLPHPWHTHTHVYAGTCICVVLGICKMCLHVHIYT